MPLWQWQEVQEVLWRWVMLDRWCSKAPLNRMGNLRGRCGGIL
jgi:hypothetical protein